MPSRHYRTALPPCRHRSLALVCRQWAQLVHSPVLLASLEIKVGPPRPLPRLRSLLEWLARRAVCQVRQLRLEVATAEGLEELALLEEWQELTASIAAAAV